eukprot:118377_1
MSTQKKRGNSVKIATGSPPQKKRRIHLDKSAVLAAIASGENQLREITKGKRMDSYKHIYDVYDKQNKKRIASKCKYCDHMWKTKHPGTIKTHIKTYHKEEMDDVDDHISDRTEQKSNKPTIVSLKDGRGRASAAFNVWETKQIKQYFENEIGIWHCPIMVSYLIEKKFNYKYVTKYETGGNHSLSKYFGRRRNETKEKPKQVKCFMCDDTFNTMDELGLHEKWHCDPRNEIITFPNEKPPIPRITCFGCNILKPMTQYDGRYHHKKIGANKFRNGVNHNCISCAFVKKGLLQTLSKVECKEERCKEMAVASQHDSDKLIFDGYCFDHYAAINGWIRDQAPYQRRFYDFLEERFGEEYHFEYEMVVKFKDGNRNYFRLDMYRKHQTTDKQDAIGIMIEYNDPWNTSHDSVDGRKKDKEREKKVALLLDIDLVSIVIHHHHDVVLQPKWAEFLNQNENAEIEKAVTRRRTCKEDIEKTIDINRERKFNELYFKVLNKILKNGPPKHIAPVNKIWRIDIFGEYD